MTWKNLGKVLIALFWFGILTLPISVLAHNIEFWPTGYWGPVYEGVCGDGGICTSLCDLIHLAQHVVYWMLSFLVFVVVPIMVVWGGIRVLTAAGSPDKISTGKRIVLGAIVGAMIGLGAFLIISTFLNLIGGEAVGWDTVQCSLP